MCAKRFLPNDVDIWEHQNKHAHTPTGPRPNFDISAPHIPTQPWHNDDRRKRANMAHKHIQTKANTDKFCETKQNLRYSPITKAAFTLQVLMLNSDLLPISDFFGCPFTRSFNCDPYPIHVFTLAIPSETSRMRGCHLAPPHVLPPENNVTCADKTSPAHLKN